MKGIFYSTLVLSLSIFLSPTTFAQGIYQLWGMTSQGGTDDIGAMFRADGEGNNLKSMHSFTKTNPGASPMYNQLTEYKEKFYSMTSQGGSNNLGVIFEWDPVSNIYIKKFDFDLANGINPHGSLAVLDGKFYGMTLFGGANDNGVIFEWNPTTNIYTKKYDFDGANGRNPYGSLLLKEGKFYGMTFSGGTNNLGVIFEWDPGANIYLKKFDFDGANGSNPYGNMVVKGDKFYGMTNKGGINDGGVIFEWDAGTNIYLKKIDFGGPIGNKPYGSLVLVNEKLYGMTYDEPGGSDEGGIFEWDPDTNVFTTKFRFPFAAGNPRGNLLFYEGKLYGMTSSEYRSKGMYLAQLFEWDLITNIYSNKYLYIKRTDTDNTYNGEYPLGSLTSVNGKIYGMTSQGGGSNRGVIFEWDPISNIYTKKVNLEDHDNGSSPNSLVFHQTHLYGLTQRGGHDGLGSIFEWDFSSNKLVKKYDFDGISSLVTPISSSSSRYPTGKLTLSNGKFYGMSYYMLTGGPHPKNHVFEWNPVNNEFMEKLFFGNGVYGNTGNLTGYQDNLYGLLKPNFSSIFKYNPASNLTSILTENYSFADGMELVERTQKFYGFGLGGVNNAGLIFEINIAGNTSIIKHDFVASTGSSPIGRMVLYDNKFYGMTDAGGLNNLGVIFEWDPVSNVYLRKYDFNSADGGNPISSLVLNTGKLYGMTRNGGSFNLGTIFEWDPVTNIYSKKSEFNGANGRNPDSKNALTLVPAMAARGIPNNCVTYEPVIIDTSNRNRWVPILDDNGFAIAEIKANGNNLGFIKASVFVNDNLIREDGDRRLYLDRNITITPQFQPTTPVDLRLYISGIEFNTIKQAANSIGSPSGISNINELGVFKNDDDCDGQLIKIASPCVTTGESWAADYVLSTTVTKFSTFYFANKANVALPLSLLEFNGGLQNNNALLNWKTENELNTLEFEVERSIDGIQYKKLGTVAAANRAGIHRYSFTDAAINLLGAKIVYYRLKQSDIDGQFIYSKIVILSLDNENTFVRLYPNPVNNELKLSISSPLRDDLKLKIMDASGRMITHQTRKIVTGSNSFTIDITRIPNGVYYLSIQGNSINKWMQFIK